MFIERTVDYQKCLLLLTIHRLNEAKNNEAEKTAQLFSKSICEGFLPGLFSIAGFLLVEFFQGDLSLGRITRGYFPGGFFMGDLFQWDFVLGDLFLEPARICPA